MTFSMRSTRLFSAAYFLSSSSSLVVKYNRSSSVYSEISLSVNADNLRILSASLDISAS